MSVATNSKDSDAPLLKRVVFVANDLSSIGGIPGRLRKVQAHAQNRGCEYFILSKSNISGDAIYNNIIATEDPKRTINMLNQWKTANDTVFITHNNFLNVHAKEIRAVVNSSPLIYFCSGQMAFMVQDSIVISNLEYVRSFKACKIVAFSDTDINFQRQLGIHGQIKGFLPVEVRDKNTFDPKRNRFIGYVGRIDFHAKGCERLVDVARCMKQAGLPPLKLFTTAGKNSPDFPRLMEMIKREGLTDQVDVVLECRDKDLIYSEIQMLLLPSKKESFGNVILEAYSYGIPVISTAYAPGPSELIEHGRTGYLLDDFTGENLVALLRKTDRKQVAALSAAAFEKHKNYSMDAHYDFIEKIATDALREFKGENTLSILPELKLAHELDRAKTLLDEKSRQAPAGRLPAAAKTAAAPQPPSAAPGSRRSHAEQLGALATLASEIDALEARRAARKKTALRR